MKRIENLQNLLKKGKMSAEAKIEVKKLISAMQSGNQSKIDDISYDLHQHIGGMNGIDSQTNKPYKLREDHEYNKKETGTTVYHEADMIAHGDY